MLIQNTKLNVKTTVFERILSVQIQYILGVKGQKDAKLIVLTNKILSRDIFWITLNGLSFVSLLFLQIK